jgi:MFS family permease
MIGRLSPRTVFILLNVYNLFFWFSRELARPTISIALTDRIDSPALVGALLSIQSFLPLLLAIPLSSVGDKYGHERVMHAGSWLTVISGLCFLAAGADQLAETTYIVLLSVGQVLSGISWMIVWVAIQALGSDGSSGSGGGAGARKAVSQLVLVMSAGSLLGPLVSGQLIERLDMNVVWYLYAALAVLQYVVSRFLLTYWNGKRQEALISGSATDEPAAASQGQSLAAAGHPDQASAARLAPASGVRQRLGRGWADLGGAAYTIVLIGSFIMMFGAELRASYLSVYLRGASMQADDIGMIVMLGALASALVRLLLGTNFSLRWSRRLLLTVSLSCTVVGVLSISWLPAGWTNAFTSICLGLGGGIGEPILILFIVESAARRRRGAAMAGRVLMNRLAMFVSPLSAGWSVHLMGNRGGFMTLGLALGALGAVSVYKLNNLLKRGMLHDNDNVS